MPKPLHISADADLTVIRVRAAGERSWVEFRGPPYHTWWVPGHNMLLHDALEGWHACILHAGDSFVLFPHHPDYARVSTLVDILDRQRHPWINQ